MATVMFIACTKQPECANAEICVKNISTEVIRYGWNTNAHSDSLLPGNSTCQKVGSLSGGSYVVTTFDSNKGVYAIKVTECEQKMEIK